MKRKSKVVPIKKDEVDLTYFGNYRMGLTDKEIKEYLKKRAGVNRLGSLYRQFTKIAGVNTGALVITDCCKKEVYLMYRHDVKRFADVLFLGTTTYFD